MDFLQQLVADLKHVFVKTVKREPSVQIKNIFESPHDLFKAAQAGQVKDGNWVSLRCYPSPFGPFVRDHFIAAGCGTDSDNRLGPGPTRLDEPPKAEQLLRLSAFMMSHWMPLGIYPYVDKSLQQVCLYDKSNMTAGQIGTISSYSFFNPYIIALIPSTLDYTYHKTSVVKGVLKKVGPEAFQQFNLTPEAFETVRKHCFTYILDLSYDGSDCIVESEEQSFWGALYASGHLNLRISDDANTISFPEKDYLNLIQDCLTRHNFQSEILHNWAGRKEIGIYARGLRITIDTLPPYMYSFHMDADVALHYAQSKHVFDRIVNELVIEINDLFLAIDGVDIRNTYDLDYTYTNLSEALTLMDSHAFNAVRDPVLTAVKQWHIERINQQSNNTPNSLITIYGDQIMGDSINFNNSGNATGIALGRSSVAHGGDIGSSKTVDDMSTSEYQKAVTDLLNHVNEVADELGDEITVLRNTVVWLLNLDPETINSQQLTNALEQRMTPEEKSIWSQAMDIAQNVGSGLLANAIFLYIQNVLK